MRYVLKIVLSLVLISITSKCIAQDVFDEENKRRYEKALTYEDSLAKVMEWKSLKEGLFMSKFGDIAFRTAYVEGGDLVPTYQRNLDCCDKSKSLKDIIDITTFKKLSGDWAWGGYFKDKKHIYHFFGNSGGGFLSIVQEADYSTFEIINDCYGRDKNHVYDMRFGLMDSIDSKKFKILPKGDVCLAKYKETYYQGNYPLDEEDLKNPEIQKAIKQLNAYIAKTKHLSN